MDWGGLEDQLIDRDRLIAVAAQAPRAGKAVEVGWSGAGTGGGQGQVGRLEAMAHLLGKFEKMSETPFRVLGVPLTEGIFTMVIN